MFCFYPTPLKRGVLEDLGALEYDDPIDYSPLMTIMKSCYMATIPISRLRKLVDEDDVSDNLSYRCPRCSKCQDCQHSNKYRAMNVQEMEGAGHYR